MTFGELKRQIQSLGFADTSDITTYKEIIIDASNRAINMVLKDVVSQAEGYFTALLSGQDDFTVPVGNIKVSFNNDTWHIPKGNQITDATLDTYVIDVPDKVIDLVPLLASHYVWLDDDAVKSLYYYNEYDDLKNALLTDMLRPRDLVFSGGLRW